MEIKVINKNKKIKIIIKIKKNKIIIQKYLMKKKYFN